MPFEILDDEAPAAGAGGGYEILGDEPAETPGTLEGIANSFKRGNLGAQRAIEGLQVTPGAVVPRMPLVARQKGFTQAMEDPAYMFGLMDAQDDPAKQAKIESLLGPKARFQTGVIDPKREFQTATTGQIADLTKQANAIPSSAAMQEWSKADNSNWWQVFARNPVEITANIFAESIPQAATGMAAGMAAGAAGGPAGAAVGAGVGSFTVEAANAFLEAAANSGVNLEDPEQVRAFFSDEAKVKEAKRFAMQRGFPIALFDGLTAGVAGKFLKPALGKGMARVAGASAKELGTQMAGGALGETAAQLASGQELSAKDIAAEAIGELATAPGEVFSNLRSEARGFEVLPEDGNSQNAEKPKEPVAPVATVPAAPAADTSADALAELQAVLRGEAPGSQRIKGALPKVQPEPAGAVSSEPVVVEKRVEVPAALTEEQRAAIEFQKRTDEAVKAAVQNPDKNYEGMSRLDLELLEGMGDARATAALRRMRARRNANVEVESAKVDLPAANVGSQGANVDFLEQQARRAQAEIEADIASGTLPAGVRSFDDLNEAVDANDYVTGKPEIGAFGKSQAWQQKDYVDFTGKLIDRVNQWLQSRPDPVSKSAPAKPAKPAKPPTAAAVAREQAKEFDRLVLENGMQAGWVTSPESLYDDSVNVKTGHGTGSIKAKILRSKELARARKQAAAVLGAQDVDLSDTAARGALAARLKEWVAANVTGPARQNDDFSHSIEKGAVGVPVSEMKVGDTLNIEGEPVRVVEVSADGEVTLQDGTRFGRQVLQDGSTIYAEEWQSVADETAEQLPAVEQKATEEAKPAAPTLKSGQKQGDLLGSGDIPFNLFAEQTQSGERIEAERQQREETARAAKAFEEKNQQELPAVVAAKPEPVAAPVSGLQDFGQKLGGARKDLQPSLNREFTDEDLATKSFSEIWPKAEVDEIEDIAVASIAHAVREEIPSKPRQRYKVARWVERVKLVRELMRITKEKGPDEVMRRMDGYKLEQLVNKIRVLREVPRSEWGRVEKVEVFPDSYRYSGDTKIPSPSAVAVVDGKTIRDSSLEGITEKVKALLAAGAADARMQFEVRGVSSSGANVGTWRVNKKGDPLKRTLKVFKDVEAKEALNYVNNPDNYEALVAAWESIKETDNVKETDVRREANRERAGADHRQGRDATPEMFMETFGFRGVEFGNWVSQGKNLKERQGMLNAAYDGLMDLAAIVGVPSNSISLNGELGLGLGSRGHGWASAHFEPGTFVINLTKTRGAGSLGHEWFHALDNYFQRHRGASGDRAGRFITYQPETYYENSQGFKLSETRYKELSARRGIRSEGDWKRVEGVRPEVASAFAELVAALDASPMAKRAQLIDAGKSGGYWSRIIERAARSFENYLITKMKDAGYHNDYLANVVGVEEFARDEGRYPYLLDSEIKPVAEAFDKLFKTVKVMGRDPVDAQLTEWIEKLGLKPGALYEGVTGAPVWITRAAARGVLQVVRAAYRAGKSIAVAVQEGIEWLRTQNIPGFDETEAKEWLDGQTLEDVATSLRRQINALGEEMDGMTARGEEIPQSMLDEYKELVDTLGDEIRSGRANSGAGRVRVDENLEENNQEARTRRAIPQWKGAERLPGGRLKDLFMGLGAWRVKSGNWLARRGARETTVVNRDVADNRANQAANAASLRVRLILNRAFDTAPGQVRVKHEVREAALTFVVEADGERSRLAEFYDQIGASEHADTKAGRQALAALEYAETNWDKLQPAAAEYKTLTETEREAELNEGVNSPEWKGGYVKHSWTRDDVGAGADPTKPAAAGTPFRKPRSVATYAEGIAQGRKPTTLNALELLADRVAGGQRKLNELAWVHGLRNLMDPVTDEPVVVDVIKKPRKPANLPPEGSDRAQAQEDAGQTYKPDWVTIAPEGYTVWRFGELEVAVQENFVGLLNKLTAASFFKGSSVKKVFGFIKSSLLMFDTFHLGRMVAWRQMFGLGGGYQKGQTLLDFSTADIREMAARGEIPAGWADGLLENKRRLDLALRTGFNVGNVLDNAWGDALHNLPVVGTFNHWLFGQYQRGAMTEAWLIEFERMSRALPNASEEQVARRVSKDLNARFGNLNRQGLFKSRTAQDLARFVFLAPQWNESLIRAELGAIGQTLKAPLESIQQRRLVVGTLMRATGAMALGTFLANQILNYAFRGKPTWENEEEGWDKKISAYIPDAISGGPGFFLNPLALPMEYTHLIEGNLHRSGGDLSEALRRVAVSRLHAAARPAEMFLTRKDALGAKLRDGEVLPAMAKALLPIPIGAVSPATAAKQLISGEPSERFPGQYQKQMMASFGVKTDQAPSAEQRIRNLAREFNREKGIVPSAEFFTGDFDELNKALRIGNNTEARKALDELLLKKTPRQVFDHYKRVAAAPFTGQQAREKEFWRGLTEEQRSQYLKAREARKATAKKAAEMLKAVAKPAAR